MLQKKHCIKSPDALCAVLPFSVSQKTAVCTVSQTNSLCTPDAYGRNFCFHSIDKKALIKGNTAQRLCD
ncbi:hypothetical protein RUMCAL_01065, partial [Ruminococcus callidus ATCC 27760]